MVSGKEKEYKDFIFDESYYSRIMEVEDVEDRKLLLRYFILYCVGREIIKVPKNIEDHYYKLIHLHVIADHKRELNKARKKKIPADMNDKTNESASL